MKVLRKIDLIVLIVMGLAAIVVTVLDYLHIIKDFKPESLTVILLASLVFHLIVSHFVEEDFQTQSTRNIEQIKRGLSLGEYRIFKDSVEMEHYLAKRVFEAKNSVCDLSWKSRISPGFSAGHRQISHSNLDRCISEASERISYREIFVFSDKRRIEKMLRRISENKKGYSCSYYEDDSRIPRLQFVIVDEEEIFFFASALHSQLCAVRSLELCKTFIPYFDEAWSAAKIIKDGPQIRENEVRRMQNLMLNFKGR